MRTINAPGVEIKEIDRSQYSPAMVGTACYVPMFTDKGEPYRPMEFTSRSAWTSYYGEPDTEAERYAYAAACEVLNQNGRLWCARLPYDNAAFEKMVGYKYKVDCNGHDISKDSDLAAYKIINDYDSEIKECAVITATGKPITYELTAIDEYRTGENNVPEGTFLIVDTTGGTYSKVTEDDRKGEAREVIGIVPVVTTAANALLAQNYINVEKQNLKDYEVIEPKILSTLEVTEEMKENGVKGSAGLKESDMVNLINTRGYYFQKTMDVTPYTIVAEIASPELYSLEGSLYNWYTTLNKFIQDYNLTDRGYDVTTLNGMKNLYNDIKDDDQTLITSEAKVSELRAALENAMNSFVGEVYTWSLIKGDGTKLSIDFSSTPPKAGTGDDAVEIPGGTSLISFTENFKTLKENGTPLWATQVSYIDPDSYGTAEDADGHPYLYGTLNVVSPAAVSSTWLDRNGGDSVPETLCLNANGYFSTIQPAVDGEGLDPEHLKDIGVVVYKMYLDATEGNKISYEPVEAYCGSLYKDDVDPNTKVTKFIDTIINSQSKYINFFSNCFAKPSTKKFYLDTCDILIAKPSAGASLGFYSSMTVEEISISKSIFDGLNKAFEKASDVNQFDIDIVCDAGIANIASFLKAIFNDKGPYDLTLTDDLGNPYLNMWKCEKASDPAVKTWKAVEQKFDNFCKKIRKDCMFIADGLRPLVLAGDKKVIRESKPANTIDVNILPYLPAICGLNTNYGAGYMDWFEVADDFTGDFFWCPPSIKAMGCYIDTDVNYNYWDAPAGLTRGIIAATDVSFSPTIKQAGAIYEKNWNYAINYPNDGIILEGQKTFQVKPSALDRVNVRRLCLRLERAVFKIARYFIYEAHTAYTRQRFVDAIDPYFKEAKVAGGLYDYKIICDESNNTPDTIDRNELHVKIGIKPVKTIEFILVDFIVGSTGGSWEEIMA